MILRQRERVVFIPEMEMTEKIGTHEDHTLKSENRTY